jgi:hypothetical protein
MASPCVPPCPNSRGKIISTVGAGFGLALALIVALTLVGLHQLAATNAHLETIVKENSVKTRLANQMRDILRDRAISMLTIVVSGDAFEKDQEMMRFYALGSGYQEVRLQLEALAERARRKPSWPASTGSPEPTGRSWSGSWIWRWRATPFWPSRNSNGRVFPCSANW